MVVGNGPLAVGNAHVYRPHESPANQRIIEDAGDAVGILMGLAIRVVRSIADYVTDTQGALKAALNVVVAAERAFDGLGT